MLQLETNSKIPKTSTNQIIPNTPGMTVPTQYHHRSNSCQSKPNNTSNSDPTFDEIRKHRSNEQLETDNKYT